MTETWKDVAGYEGIYQISNTGKVKSCARNVYQDGRLKYKKPEKILKGYKLSCGYMMVDLRVNCNRERKTIHRLVAEAYLPNKENKPMVNHIDGDKLNNSVENLEWVTGSENVIHALDMGLSPVGEKVKQSKLTAEQVKYIKGNYIPRNREFGQSALARKFGVSSSAIKMIVTGINWKRCC